MSDPTHDEDFTPRVDVDLTPHPESLPLTDKQRTDSLELRVAFLESKVGKIENVLRKLQAKDEPE